MGGSTVVAKSTCAVLIIFTLAVALPVNAISHRKTLSSASVELQSSKCVILPPPPEKSCHPLPPIRPPEFPGRH
ncbi:hypothetical protein Nepgr_028762 [Nepenthes gracilis]|uniref:Uncharacterized protein n=1 Tax=Nepenthes gracilis TaxID=150966 RepID=A0AAD3TCW2_NEPGR|nr:hypothetical protein Nepgr_028762 [Nepenthes gracilis]